MVNRDPRRSRPHRSCRQPRHRSRPVADSNTRRHATHPDAEVLDYRRFLAAADNHPKDRHVAAAAMASHPALADSAGRTVCRRSRAAPPAVAVPTSRPRSGFATGCAARFAGSPSTTTTFSTFARAGSDSSRLHVRQRDIRIATARYAEPSTPDPVVAPPSLRPPDVYLRLYERQGIE